MSNEQKDWEQELEHESREDLIKLVKHFQGIALGTYDAQKDEEHYMLGKAVDKFMNAAALELRGGVIEAQDESGDWHVIGLSTFIVGWNTKYNHDNTRFLEPEGTKEES